MSKTSNGRRLSREDDAKTGHVIYDFTLFRNGELMDEISKRGNERYPILHKGMDFNLFMDYLRDVKDVCQLISSYTSFYELYPPLGVTAGSSFDFPGDSYACRLFIDDTKRMLSAAPATPLLNGYSGIAYHRMWRYLMPDPLDMYHPCLIERASDGMLILFYGDIIRRVNLDPNSITRFYLEIECVIEVRNEQGNNETHVFAGSFITRRAEERSVVLHDFEATRLLPPAF